MAVVKKVNPITQAAQDATSAIGASRALSVSMRLAGSQLASVLTGAARSPFPYLRVVGLGGLGVLSLAELWRTYGANRLALGNGPVEERTAAMSAAAKSVRPPLAAFGRNISQSMVLGFALRAILGNVTINPSHYAIGADLGENYDPLTGMVMLLSLFDPGLTDLGHNISLLVSTDAASQLLLAKQNTNAGLAREALLAGQVMKSSADGISMLSQQISPIIFKLDAVDKLVKTQAARWFRLPPDALRNLKEAVKGIATLKKTLMKTIEDQAKVLQTLSTTAEEAKKTQSVVASQKEKETADLQRLSALVSDTIRGITTIFALKD